MRTIWNDVERCGTIWNDMRTICERYGTIWNLNVQERSSNVQERSSNVPPGKL
jgi:hypothetical protein